MGPGDIAAVVDLGSNSVRLLVARALNASGFEVVDEERFSARLGEGQADGGLAADAVQRGLLALRIMAEVASAYAPTVVVVVGTEALRRATNAARFVASAKALTGLDVRILSGEEEAAASFLGVVNSTAIDDGWVLDLGGGSLEIMEVHRRSLTQALSAPLGAIYAHERYLPSDPPSNREIRALRKAVRQHLRGLPGGSSLVATGGAVRNLARIVRLARRYPLRHIHGLVIGRREVQRVARQLSRASTEQRRRIPGVGASRAETLHAAAIVIDEVMDILGAPELTVAGQGLREGLLWQTLRPGDAVLPDVRRASIGSLALANGVDASFAEPVVATALAVFDALAPKFELTPAARDLLEAAARLAGIGMHVDYYDRDRHAEYLVSSGDLHGFTHREIVLLAALVRWAAGGAPSLTAYKQIVLPGDTTLAAMLASILGVARAVHRRRPSPVQAVTAELRRTTMRLTLAMDASPDAELHALDAQRQRFESLFSRTIALRTDRS